jgi:chondroitin AC lyase
MKLRTSLFILIFVLTSCAVKNSGDRKIASSEEQDIALIKERIRNDYLIPGPIEEIAKYQIEFIKTWIDTQRPDGTWPDIDYSLVNDVKFPPSYHSTRMQYMAQAYSTEGHPYFNNREMLAVLWKAYDHWTLKDYQSYNWWFNEIGIAGHFQRTMILLEKLLSKTRFDAGIKILNRAKIGKTGQNLLWHAETVLVRSLLVKDILTAKEALKAAQEEVFVSSTEGIKEDMSFHQHGDLIYNGGYGAGFSFSIARLVGMTAGTFAAFDNKTFDLISSYILDGQRWFTRNNKFDYSIVGREIVRKNKNATPLAKACKLMGSYPSKRVDEFKNCASSIEDNKTHSLEGNKHFWKSDMMAHQRKAFYTSTRMYSSRTINNDAPSNGEGLLSHHLADGATYIMKDGSEYENIFPLWDWTKIPGTTVEQKKLKPAVFIPGNWEAFAHIRYYGKSAFVGGASDGVDGVAGMNFIGNKTYEKLDAKKAWFYFKDGFVALGTDIKCASCANVATTLDQSYLKSNVSTIDVNGNIKSLVNGEAQFSNLKAIVHNEMTFAFPVPQKINIKSGLQVGNWKRISEQLDDTKIESNLFTAWIQHGFNAEVDKYQYVVFPKMNVEAASQLNLNNKISIINRSNVQAVYFKEYSMLQAVFYKIDSIDLNNMQVSVSAPAILMIKKTNRQTKLSVTDPTQKLSSMTVTIDGHEHVINFSNMRGKTVTINI